MDTFKPLQHMPLVTLLGTREWDEVTDKPISLALILHLAMQNTLPTFDEVAHACAQTCQVQVSFGTDCDVPAAVLCDTCCTVDELRLAESKLQNVDPAACCVQDVESTALAPTEQLGSYECLHVSCLDTTPISGHMSTEDTGRIVPHLPLLMLCDTPHDHTCDATNPDLPVVASWEGVFEHVITDAQVDEPATPCDPTFSCQHLHASRRLASETMSLATGVDQDSRPHLRLPKDLPCTAETDPAALLFSSDFLSDAPASVQSRQPMPCNLASVDVESPGEIPCPGDNSVGSKPLGLDSWECGQLPRMPEDFSSATHEPNVALGLIDPLCALPSDVQPSRKALCDFAHADSLSQEVVHCPRDAGESTMPDCTAQGESGQLPRMPEVCTDIVQPDSLPAQPDLDLIAATAIDVSDAETGLLDEPTNITPNDVHPCQTQSLKRAAPDADLFFHLPVFRSPLVHLPGQSLLKLHSPAPRSLEEFHGIRMQRMHVTDRLQILENQGPIWADDEMTWHLEQTCNLCAQRKKNCLGNFPFDKVAYVDPLMLQGWVASDFRPLDAWLQSNVDDDTCLLCTLHNDGHWTPLAIWVKDQVMQVRTWDTQSVNHDHVEAFVQAVVNHAHLPYVHHRLHRMFCEHSCGALLPEIDAQAAAVHKSLRKEFQDSLKLHSTCLKPWLWGNGTVDQAVQGLHKVLSQQGVPDDQLDSRCRAAVRAIGSGPVLTALNSKTPWRQLKSLGNNVKFQFLLPTELDAKIAKQAGNGPVGRSKGVKSSRKPVADTAPVAIDPAKLVISPGTFHCQGQPLVQVSLQNLGPLTEGVVICRAIDVEPYLRSGKALSAGPIGLLLLHGPQESWSTSLPQSVVTVPCRCIANKEPLLIEATLVQLGAGQVERTVEQAPVCIDTLDVCAVKFLTYRDEVACDWSEFCSSPVKYIVEHFPILKMCHESPCECPHWHNKEKINTKTPILDVWRRQFLRGGFKPEQASNASMYTVCLRTPLCLLEQLLHASGSGGTYTEPRTPDAKEVDTNFVVIWVPKVSKAELWHLKQTNPTVVGVARAGDRVGLRTLAKHASALHEAVKPGSSFLPVGPRQTWQVGPMPFGADRNSITKALTSLPWEVKVLQPVKTLPGRGSLWHVQSVSPPPQTMMQMKHGEVVFTCVRAHDTDGKTQPAVPIATPETIALCGTSKQPAKAVASTDPWAQNDPWGQWQGPTTAGPTVTATLKQLETKVHDAVLAKLPTTTPMDDDVPDRLNNLESKLQTLMSKHQTLEGQVQEHAARHTAQLTSIQTQLHGHVESQQQSMSAMFEQQMCQIRSLLSKRTRDDAELWQRGVGTLVALILCFLCIASALQPLFASRVSLYPIIFAFVGAMYLLLPWGGLCRFLRPLRFGACHKPTCTHSPVSVLLVLFLCSRIGEAANPGPPADRVQHEFCIGAFNPSGLAHKATYVSEFLSHGDIWLVSETHLTEKAVRSFRDEMKFAGSSHKFCIGGHPVPPRHDSQIAGQWRGVATLAKHPTKAVPHEWNDFLHRSSRLQVTTTLMFDMWITCGTIYGETCGPDHPLYLQNNERLLKAMTEQICLHSVGPRVIAGDWNVHPGDLPSFETLHQCGFRELQDIAFERWGQLPRPTCKNASRKDYCYLSPELQSMLCRVTVDDTIWSDHAVLCGHFQGHVHDLGRLEWKLPKPFPWPAEFDVGRCTWPDRTIDPTARYHQIWQELETAARQQVPDAVPRNMLGRGRPIKLRRTYDNHKMKPHAGRLGDIEPTFHGPSLMHARWFRQLRRLQAYLRFARGPNWTPDHEHALNLWGAIKRATGFQCSFAAWWTTCKHRLANAPAILPESPPDPLLASAVYESFTLAVRHFESQLKQQCRTYARKRRVESPNVIFQDIKAPGKEGVNILVQANTAQVTGVDDAWCQVDLTSAVTFDDSKAVWRKGKPFTIIHSEADSLWLHSVDSISVGDTLTQTALRGQADELAAEFTAAWKKRWMRHQDVPPSQWETIINFARATLPKVACKYTPLDAHTLHDAVRRKRKRSARGLDGISLDDLRALPTEALEQLCDICRTAEDIGHWPKQALAGKVSSIAKNAHPQGPSDFRPITVLSHLYRLWGSHHCSGLLRDLNDALPSQLYGNRRGCCATMVWTALCWEIESAQATSRPLCGIQCDIQKAFNHLPRLVCFEAAAAVGFPIQVLMGWAAALHDLTRHFELRDHLSEGIPSCTGMPEGDSLSCIGMLLIDWMFDRRYAVTCPMVSPVSFVDDWQLLVRDPAQVTAAVSQLERFCSAVDMLLDRRKTFAWATHAPARAVLREQGHTVEPCARTLGAHLQYTLQQTNNTLTKKLADMPPLWDRLRMTQSPHHVKSRAIRAAAWPNCLHGCFAVSLGQHHYSSLRSGAVKGLGANGSGVNPWLVLGAIEPSCTDPEFWTTCTTLRQTRLCGDPDHVLPLLASLAHGSDGPPNGITTTLLTRLQRLGWSIDFAGKCHDAWGAFSLFDSHLGEVVTRAEWAWKSVIAQQVSHRPGVSVGWPWLYQIVVKHAANPWPSHVPESFEWCHFHRGRQSQMGRCPGWPMWVLPMSRRTVP